MLKLSGRRSNSVSGNATSQASGFPRLHDCASYPRVIDTAIFGEMRLAILMALVVGLIGASPEISAGSSGELGVSEKMAVEVFLRTYLKSPYYDYKKTRYIARAAHLHGNERDVIVYLEDRYSCGSGGCTTLVLSPKGRSSYRVVTSMTIVQLPIRILETTANGWHDIGVWVQGGGIQPGYEAVLPFNGRSYPRNPTVPPAKPLMQPRGDVVIARNTQGVLLYR